MSKLYKARSLLYRRQILQENIRWIALDEIYKIYIFYTAQTSIFQKFFVKLFRIFRQSVAKFVVFEFFSHCLLYTSPSPRDATLSRMPSSA